LEQSFQEENKAMPGPPKQFDREEALSRAIEVFWEQGYLGTSIEDLLEAMELSRSSMYATFGDKKALFLEALQVWIDEEIAQFVETLRGPGSLIERIGEAFRQRHEAQKALGNAGCLYGNTVAEGGMQDPEMARVLETFVRRGERILVSTFEDAVRAKELPKGTDVHALAVFSITLSQGALLLGRGRPDLFDQIAPSLLRVIGSGAFTES
jgi:AcrR family transcriptional regulator